MQISRRSFLKYCTLASASLGLGVSELEALGQTLAKADSPPILWLQGSGCSGCTVSFLNYVSPTAPVDATDVLIRGVSLAYHPMLSAAAGEAAVAAIRKPADFVLVVEGGIPTAFAGHTCIPWSEGGKEVTFQQAVRDLAGRARQVVCVGTCASYGGVSAMGTNPTGVRSVRTEIGKQTINVPGCPPHPNWIVGTLLAVLQGKSLPLDANGRPTSIFARRMCDQCPFRGRGETSSLGVRGMCMERLGCHGRESSAPCPTEGWNNGVSWCVAAGSPCLGCTEPSFPAAGLGGRGGRRGFGPGGGPGGGPGRGRGPGRRMD